MGGRKLSLLLGLGAVAAGVVARADEVTYEDRDGVRYQVVRRVVERQVPVTQMQSQQQTYYRQQVVNETVEQQQLYAVPVTQYQLVSTLHGRWNPFVTPYWTHEYQPVTVWQQQVAKVQLPVARATLQPETRTVQAPVTTYRLAKEEVTYRTPIGAATQPAATQALADAQPLGSTPAAATEGYAAAAPTPAQPSATLVARAPGSVPTPAPPMSAGGVALESDPPRQASPWQREGDGRYR